MKKIILSSISGAMMLVWSAVAYADVQFGFGLMVGQVETDGTETEGTAADTSTRTKSLKESFYGADLFIEHISDNFTVGLSYVPVDVNLGKGSRTDANGSDPAENDDGTRTAEADLTDFYTLYANVPVGGNGWYGLLGFHFATVETTETLPNSSYPNEDITGYQIGLGQRLGDNLKYELAYSDFEDISISATGGNTGNSVDADADALTFRLSVGF